MKTANQKCRQFVQSKTDFKGSNLYGITENGNYVVYSYGRHWPLFAYINGQWYANLDKYSVSTSRHYNQAHPFTDTIPSDTDTLKGLIAA